MKSFNLKINVFSSSFTFPNTRSFLFPLKKYKYFFKKNGLDFNFYTKTINYNCDIVFIESNFYGKRWIRETNEILSELKQIRKKVKKIIYFDTSDSTSILNPEIIKCVDKYCKGQILKKLFDYKKKFYGNRIFTDYSRKFFGVKDGNESFSVPVLEQDDLNKIQIFWNSSISNYSLFGKFTNEIYRFLPLNIFLFFPKKILIKKKKEIFLRMNMNYTRKTVEWHRKMSVINILKNNNFDKINFFRYYRELSQSKVSLSPFGWGEINYRDYETFISGSLLLKPNMNHLKTWPDLYRNDETYIGYDWSCNDLKKKINQISDNFYKYEKIAIKGQNNYIDFLNDKRLKDKILKRLIMIITS